MALMSYPTNDPNLLIYQLLQGKLLYKCTVLITTRPSASEYLLKFFNCETSKHYEIIGFSSENIVDYLKKNIFTDEPHLLPNFTDYYKSVPIVEGLMHVPLNAAIVAQLFKENYHQGMHFPLTMTELYNSLTCTLLRRYLNDAHAVPKKLTEEADIKKLPSNVQSSFYNILQYAYNRTIYKESASPGGEFDTLGLLNTVKIFSISAGQTEYHEFLHETLQEFLVAIYLSIKQMPSEECIEHSSDNVALFLSGIASINENYSMSKQLIESLIQRKVDPNILIRCFFENTRLLSSSICLTIQNPFYSTQPSDYYMAGYLTTNYGISLSVSIYCEDIPHLKMFQKGLQSKINATASPKRGVLQTLTVVCYTDKTEIAEELAEIYKAPVAKNILVLAGQHSIDFIDSVQQSAFETLKISPRSFLPIIDSKNETFVTSDLNWTEESCKSLENLLQAPNTSITQIIVDRPTNAEKSEHLLKILFCPTGLKVLRIKSFDFRNISADVMKILKTNTNIVQLEMVDCHLTKLLVSSLLSNSGVKELSIEGWYAAKDATLLKELINKGSFEVIKILQCSDIEIVDVQAFVKEAERNPLLKQLYLTKRTYSRLPVQHRITKINFEADIDCHAPLVKFGN